MAASLARTEPTAAGSRVSAAAFASLLALVVLAHLDAVGNRLSAGLPVSLYTMLYGLPVALAALALFDSGGSRLAAVPARGARLTALLFLWALFAWTLSAYRAPGWEYLVDLAAAMGLLLLVTALVDSPERLRAAIWTMILSGLASALIVYWDYATGQRLVSTAPAAVTAEAFGYARSSGGSDQNPTTAAQMLMVGVGLLLGQMVRSGRRLPLAGAILVTCVVALALMSARSAIIGALVIAALILLSLRRQRAFAVALAALLGVIGIVVLVAPPTVAERFIALGNWSEDPTLFRRLAYLRAGGDLLAGSPLWGVGPGNFPLYFTGEEYRFLPGRAPEPRELHNTYLDAAVELGLAGFAILAALLVTALAACRRGFGAPSPLGWASYAIFLALSGLLVASFFMPNKDMRYLWILLGLAFQAGRMAAAREAAP